MYHRSCEVVRTALGANPAVAEAIMADVYSRQILAVCRSPLLQGSALDTVRAGEGGRSDCVYEGEALR